jgi:uncharacterized protein (TIGR02145 family)
MYKFLPLFLILFFIDIQSDAQYGIFFQAIARDNFNNPAKDRKIFVQSNIIQTSPSGKIVFVEEHQTNTDATGIFNIMVGNGIRVGGSIPSFNAIDWAQYPYYLNIKIAITPIGASTNWDYTKEWIDIGTSIFGAVPFALYSANTAQINDKLNAIDTARMLTVYAKEKAVQALSSLVDTKLATKDTIAMLSPYSRIKYTDSALFTKLNADDTIKYAKKIYTDSVLLTKMNIEDTIKYAKLLYTDAALSTKLNMTDTIKYAKKIYTDSALLTKLNAVDSIKYAKLLYTDAALSKKLNVTDTILFTKKLYTDSALLTKLSVTGNAATSTIASFAIMAGTASTATKLSVSKKINNVDFDGSGDITIKADAGTLTGASLNTTVTNSSLTSVGTLTNTIINGKLVVGATLATSNSAVLEVSSTTQGFLPPRMSTSQRDGISIPTTGMVIFNTTTNGLEVKSSNGWVLLTPSNAVSLPTIVIGMQQWMDKNLDVLTYRNGDLIPQVKDPTAWAALTTGAWCYFNNDPSGYGAIYGKLYNWYAVNDPRGLAPQGWHIATYDEWATLSTILGGTTVAGSKLKTAGTSRWVSPNTGATNESGFSALPGSYRDIDGRFLNFTGQSGYWWTAKEFNTSNAFYYFLNNTIENLLWGNENKKRGFSVRIIRD